MTTQQSQLHRNCSTPHGHNGFLVVVPWFRERDRHRWFALRFARPGRGERTIPSRRSPAFRRHSFRHARCRCR